MNDVAAVAAALANGIALERKADLTLPRELLAQTVELIIAGLQATANRPPG